MLHGAEATAAAVSELAGSVDVLHVSAHGRHSSENPLFSGFELADGPWFGYDIDQLTSVPDVVLLSACEVGRSTLRGGEELIGMTAAWLHAGSRCVIASAAAINDAVAHDVLVGGAPRAVLRTPSRGRPGAGAGRGRPRRSTRAVGLLRVSRGRGPDHWRTDDRFRACRACRLWPVSS